jgi:hypothetical protein
MGENRRAIMSRWQIAVQAFGLALLAALACSPAVPAQGKDSPKPGKVSGILTDKQDDWVKVKADGEEEAVKYTIDSSNKKLVASLKGIFTVCRVSLTWTGDGDRKLVSMRKLATKQTGKVTGVVLGAYGWWVEVKPKGGVPDGYAAKFPFDKNKAMMEKLKSLQKGDVVTIIYVTDRERHRIDQMKVVKTADKE